MALAKLEGNWRIPEGGLRFRFLYREVEMRLRGDLGFRLQGGFGFRRSFGLQGQGFWVWRGVLGPGCFK